MSVKLFKSLLYKSSQIQAEIDRESSAPFPDRYRIIKLKKIRLSIKDRLYRLMKKYNPLSLELDMQLSPVRARKTAGKKQGIYS